MIPLPAFVPVDGPDAAWLVRLSPKCGAEVTWLGDDGWEVWIRKDKDRTRWIYCVDTLDDMNRVLGEWLP